MLPPLICLMYLAVMQFADNRTLRVKSFIMLIIHAPLTKAQIQPNLIMPKLWWISSIYALKSQTLDMQDYSELSLATKMETPVMRLRNFLLSLSRAAKPQAYAEYQELKDYAQSLGLDELKPWDVAYVSEKIRQAKFSLTSDELGPYFPLPVVLDGLFEICQRLFGVEISLPKNKTMLHGMRMCCCLCDS